MRRLTTVLLILTLALLTPNLLFAKGEDADKEKEDSKLKASSFSGLKLRGIGPALTSGRVADFAVHPEHHNVWYVAMASGGVWKTENDGITWKHVFRNEGSYAVGVVELDPTNPDVVWVGSGENNSQRSVGFGDGVYKSLDGGKSWKNMGLEDSGHISMIRFHPDDSDTVFVAAQGPLWNSGGDRGLYRTTDGGKMLDRHCCQVQAVPAK